jgi:uncharacterized protein
MEYIEDIAALEALYGTPGVASIRKVADHLTPTYSRWIEASRFVVLATVGAEGTDGSPRGDDGPSCCRSVQIPSPCQTGAATTGSTACAT